MTSGIYKLTFSSGSTYIGKSINIENRWKQHFDKMSKNKAAELMQNEFSRYGYPTGEVIFECHEDHIDIVEACFINRLRPNINGTYPADPFAGITEDIFDVLMSFLDMSTLEHVSTICGLKDSIRTKTSLLETAELSNSSLMVKRSNEEINRDVNKRINSLTKALKERESIISKLEDTTKLMQDRIDYLNRPWWEKWFK